MLEFKIDGRVVLGARRMTAKMKNELVDLLAVLYASKKAGYYPSVTPRQVDITRMYFHKGVAFIYPDESRKEFAVFFSRGQQQVSHQDEASKGGLATENPCCGSLVLIDWEFRDALLV